KIRNQRNQSNRANDEPTEYISALFNLARFQTSESFRKVADAVSPTLLTSLKWASMFPHTSAAHSPPNFSSHLSSESLTAALTMSRLTASRWNTCKRSDVIAENSVSRGSALLISTQMRLNR